MQKQQHRTLNIDKDDIYVNIRDLLHIVILKLIKFKPDMNSIDYTTSLRVIILAHKQATCIYFLIKFAPNNAITTWGS